MASIASLEPAKLSKIPIPIQCEQYRKAVEAYFGPLTDEALFVASKESGCRESAVSGQNFDGSKDYCLFQITREAHVTNDLDACIRRAKEKYTAGRIGVENWSDFYAVCKRVVLPNGEDGTPIPKHPQFINNCN